MNKCNETERMLVAEYYQRVFGTELPESVVGKGRIKRLLEIGRAHV